MRWTCMISMDFIRVHRIFCQNVPLTNLDHTRLPIIDHAVILALAPFLLKFLAIATKAIIMFQSGFGGGWSYVLIFVRHVRHVGHVQSAQLSTHYSPTPSPSPQSDHRQQHLRLRGYFLRIELLGSKAVKDVGLLFLMPLLLLLVLLSTR
jgi:hypothetical protein